jgi:hypothetical protein
MNYGGGRDEEDEVAGLQLLAHRKTRVAPAKQTADGHRTGLLRHHNNGRRIGGAAVGHNDRFE